MTCMKIFLHFLRHNAQQIVGSIFKTEKIKKILTYISTKSLNFTFLDIGSTQLIRRPSKYITSSCSQPWENIILSNYSGLTFFVLISESAEVVDDPCQGHPKTKGCHHNKKKKKTKVKIILRPMVVGPSRGVVHNPLATF